jgi:hypothetical protein
LIYLVPGERFELPTNGLQNRCSTAELTRLTSNFGARLRFRVWCFSHLEYDIRYDSWPVKGGARSNQQP